MALEGGYGADKIATIEQAILPENEGTWPGIWFKSGQTDYTVYGRYDYVYSLLFGRQISGGSIRIISDHIGSMKWSLFSKPTIFDWGGSIFTTHDLLCNLEDKIDHVVMVNLPTPQVEFAKWFIKRIIESVIDPEIDLILYGAMSVGDEARMLPFIEREYGVNEVDAEGSRPIVVMSELLEHIQSPEILVSNLVTAGVKHFYFASSFCTPAYGHHIPITIDGAQYETPRQSNKAWKIAAERLGIKLTKLAGWNSRVYYGYVER
jgi:hypothetical protein